MDISRVLAFFTGDFSIGTVLIIAYLIISYKDLKHIKQDLSNHVTDTNKKIDTLADSIKETNTIIRENYKEINQKLENQSKRFDKLYNLILKP